MGQSGCKTCLGANPSTDTIKFGADSNATLLANVAGTKESEQIKLASDAERRKFHENERVRLEQEAAERRRIEQEAAERRRIEIQQEEERCKMEDERRIAEKQRLLEAERESKAKADAEAEAMRAALEAKASDERAKEAERKALQQAQRKTDEFLKSRGFKGINVPRKKMFKTSYALHAAVEENCLVAVEALLKCGADKAVKNSAGKTALEHAQKLDKGKSHATVIAALS